jgi:hypothetical protein
MAAKGSTTSPFTRLEVNSLHTGNGLSTTVRRSTRAEYDIGSRVLERWQGRNPSEILEIWNEICSSPGQRPPNPADFAWQFLGMVI